MISPEPGTNDTLQKKKKTDQQFIKIYNNQYTIREAQNHLEQWQTVGRASSARCQALIHNR